MKKKKRRWFDAFLVILLLAGVGFAAAMALAPQQVREAWRQAQASLDRLAAKPVDAAADPKSAAQSLPSVALAPAAKSSVVVDVRKPSKLPAPTKSSAASKPAAESNPIKEAINTKQLPETTLAQLPPPPGAKPKTARPEPSAATAVDGALFAFPTDESGRLLAERLTPPARMPLAPTPFVRAPRPRASGMPEDLAPHLGNLPPAAVGSAPVVVGAEQRTPQRGQPALDRPPLAAEVDPARPRRPTWPASPLAFAASAKPEAVPSLRYVGLPVNDAVTPQDDATAESSRSAMLAGTAVPQPVPPPHVPLAIPDPFERARVIELPSPPAERDPPESSFQRPQPPRFPLPEPKAKKQ